jgi:single-stranded-DNA-specific exonuclease
MRYRWAIRSAVIQADPCKFDGLPSVVEDCLRARGVCDAAAAARYLEPRLEQLSDPFDFSSMRALVTRLQSARGRGETVVVFGDYDVDGVTATALLEEVLGTLGWVVKSHIPDRFSDGYGLTRESVRRCLARHPSRLVLAVDCGANAAALVSELAAQGVDVLVLGHHAPGIDGLPDCPCLHPSTLPTQDHPARSASAVGLAFKLAHALVKEGRRLGAAAELNFDIRPLLDLVALGTVADLVPLTGENRVLVTSGLRRLRASRRAGLRALMDLAGIDGELGVWQVGFQLGPRLNAAGRLDTADRALELLRARDSQEAQCLAESIDQQNRARQALERGVSEQAIARLRAAFDPEQDFVLVTADAGWHLGVVGIVASRVVREFNRPALILGGDGDVLRGSGRSLPGFDFAEALGACSDLVERGGGHAMAVGCSVRAERLDGVRERLNLLARDRFGGTILPPELLLDAELPLGDLSDRLVGWLAKLEPTGQGNPPARFVVRDLRLMGPAQRMGREANHLRFKVTDGQAAVDVVWWGGGKEPWPTGTFDLAVEPRLNEYRGRRSVQLRMLDWRPADQGSAASGAL